MLLLVFSKMVKKTAINTSNIPVSQVLNNKILKMILNTSQLLEILQSTSVSNEFLDKAVYTWLFQLILERRASKNQRKTPLQMGR